MTRSKGEYLCGKNAVPPFKKYVRPPLTTWTSNFPKWESGCYISVWILSVLYLCYSVFHASNEHVEDLDNYHMSQGWGIIGRQKDKYDFEWDFWSSYLYKGWPWLLGHIIIGHVCRIKYLKLRKYLKLIYISYSTMALFMFLGIRVVAFLVAHTAVVFLCALSSSALLIAIVSAGLISTLNSTTLVVLMKEYLLVHEEGESRPFYLMMFVTAMCNLRYTSFAMEKCWDLQKKSQSVKRKETSDISLNSEIKFSGECDSACNDNDSPSIRSQSKLEIESKSPKVKLKLNNYSPRSRYRRKKKEETDSNAIESSRNSDSFGLLTENEKFPAMQYSLVDGMLYTFYLPLFCTGPLLTYEKFLVQCNSCWQPWSWYTLKPVILSFFRVLWWALFCEVILHYMYFSSLMGNEEILSKVPLWTLAGIGYCQGQFFMVKYVVMFGLPACIASLDQIVVPKGPRCITVIYLYSDMWKYFDRGLYDFIKRYIYVPLGGSQSGLTQRLFASFCCFTFIFIWHGAEMDLFVWTLINFIGITIETIGRIIVNSKHVNKIETLYIGASASRMIKAAFAVPLFALSVIAIFTFFRGTRVGYIYLERLVLNGWPVPIFTLFSILYCSVQTSMEIDRWRKKRLKKV